eukprot:507547-Ditylum_brightwellii.AAC.1
MDDAPESPNDGSHLIEICMWFIRYSEDTGRILEKNFGENLGGSVVGRLICSHVGRNIVSNVGGDISGNIGSNDENYAVGDINGNVGGHNNKNIGGMIQRDNENIGESRVWYP